VSRKTYVPVGTGTVGIDEAVLSTICTASIVVGEVGLARTIPGLDSDAAEVSPQGVSKISWATGEANSRCINGSLTGTLVPMFSFWKVCRGCDFLGSKTSLGLFKDWDSVRTPTGTLLGD